MRLRSPRNFRHKPVRVPTWFLPRAYVVVPSKPPQLWGFCIRNNATMMSNVESDDRFLRTLVVCLGGAAPACTSLLFVLALGMDRYRHAFFGGAVVALGVFTARDFIRRI